MIGSIKRQFRIRGTTDTPPSWIIRYALHNSFTAAYGDMMLVDAITHGVSKIHKFYWVSNYPELIIPYIDMYVDERSDTLFRTSFYESSRMKMRRYDAYMNNNAGGWYSLLESTDIRSHDQAFAYGVKCGNIKRTWKNPTFKVVSDLYPIN